MEIHRYSSYSIRRGEIVVASAYRSGVALKEEETGIVYDYPDKSEIAYINLLTPDGSPAWVSDRAQLWNRINQAQPRRNSQCARELYIPLLRQLSLEQNIRLLERFVQEQFVKLGMVADVAIHHNEQGSLHAHLLLTTQLIVADGFGAKERSWNDRALLKAQRQAWSNCCIAALQEVGANSSTVNTCDLFDYNSELILFLSRQLKQLSARIAQEKCLARKQARQPGKSREELNLIKGTFPAPWGVSPCKA